MTGANYTGGKRNFARARFRDSTRRAQKSHFGRRRLEILSRGLGNGAQSKEEESSGISGILLEHAQREISRLPEYMPSNGTEAPDTFSGLSSPFISEHGIKPSKVVHTPDSESYPSLRAEVDRVLEFSRTIGLCNYPSSSRRQSGSASLTSDVDSQSRQRNCYDGSPISGFSERQHLGVPLDSVAPCSGNLETTGARSPHSGSFRKPAFTPVRRSRERDSGYTEPASDCGYQPREHHTPQRKAQPIDTLKPQFSQDKFSPGFSGRKFYAMDSFSPSFDALEFPTSPLPPSSPLASSAVHGSLLSLCQARHVNEGTHSDFNTTPARGSCGADSSSLSGYLRSMTPDFVPKSVPLQYLPHSHHVHKVPTPLFIPSSSKADLISELLKRDNPWNAIGDLLDLPPIPTANETYFKEITSRRTVSHERISPLASSSSMGQADRVTSSSSARIEDTILRAAQSDGALPTTNPVSHGVNSPSSPLLCGYLGPTIRTVISLASQSRRDRDVGSSGQSGFHTPSLAIRSLPIPDELSQPLLEPRNPLASPRGLGRTLDWNNFSACVAGETPSGFATPRRSLSPISKPPHLLTTSALSSPDSMHWNTISEIDLDALIPKTPSTQITMARTHRPKLVCPDLFGDKKDDLRRIS